MSEPETGEAEKPSMIAKKKGNDAYLAKKYDEAISFYSEAINLEPDNAVFYSNRSACYAALKQWQKAYEDAIQCVAKDPKFIKGYYRLSAAQTELKLYDDSLSTLKAALTIEPENEVLLRQMKTVQQKKSGVLINPAKPKKKLSEAEMKEIMELQEQTNSYIRDKRTVQAKINHLKREAKINKLTATNIESLAPGTKMYRSLGKCFMYATREEIEGRLDAEVDVINKDYKDLSDRQEYLERRILANTEHVKDVTSGM